MSRVSCGSQRHLPWLSDSCCSSRLAQHQVKMKSSPVLQSWGCCADEVSSVQNHHWLVGTAMVKHKGGRWCSHTHYLCSYTWTGIRTHLTAVFITKRLENQACDQLKIWVGWWKRRIFSSLIMNAKLPFFKTLPPILRLLHRKCMWSLWRLFLKKRSCIHLIYPGLALSGQTSCAVKIMICKVLQNACDTPKY